MKTICSWCDRVVRDGTEPATHTICEDCLTALEVDVSEPMLETGGQLA